MNRPFALALAVIILFACVAQDAAAQNLVVTNAKILDGRGGVMQNGSVVVRDGKIVSVSAGTAPAVPGARVIDARGMTLAPGFIDAHRHPVGGNGDEWLAQRAVAQMQEFLDAGFTTIQSAGDSPQHVVEMRKRIESGQVRGPRLISAGRVPLARAAAPPAAAPGAPRVDPARTDRSWPHLRPTGAAGRIPEADTVAAVAALAKIGVDAIKTAILVTPGGPEIDTLSLVVREGNKHGLRTFTHAIGVEDVLGALKAGTTALAHTPHVGYLTSEQSKAIAAARVPMTSTIGLWVPIFSVGDAPVFRDRLEYPWHALQSAGFGPVNARMAVNDGVVYGYGTDTPWPPRQSLEYELRSLHLVFSPQEIVSILTRNAATVVGRESQVGTLEPGKLADIVIINGDPLTQIHDLTKVVMTIKGGVVVSDTRAAAAAAR